MVLVIGLERGADLHIAQLPLTVSCSSKIQIGFTFLVPAYLGSPGKRVVKRVCVCLCVSKYNRCFMTRPVELNQINCRSNLVRLSL